MRLPVAPFLRRSLQQGARSGKGYLVRGALLALLLLMMLTVYQSRRFFGAPGLQLLELMAIANAVVICLAGPGFFASVITDEKENMTLGLLKMTGLGAFWLLTGRFAQQLLEALLLLAVQVPLVVLAVTLGGVSQAQVAAVYVALGIHMVLVSGFALLCSTVCARTARAGFLCVLGLGAFFLGTPLTRWWLATAIRDGRVAATGLFARGAGEALGVLNDASVFTRLREVLLTGFAGGPWSVQGWLDLAAGLVCFLLSWCVFERLTREHHSTGPARSIGLRRRWGGGPGRTWGLPMAWKEFNFIGGGKVGLVARFVLVGALIAFMATTLWSGSPRVSRGELGALAMGVAIGIGLLDAAVQVSRAFGGELKWQTLACVMIVPRSTRAIAYDKVLGCALGLFPYAVWFTVGVILNPELFTDTLSGMWDEQALWYVIAQGALFYHLVAYFSLLMRRGGLVAAFVVWYLSSAMLGPFLMFAAMSWIGEEAMVIIVTLVIVGVTVVLHGATLRRLKRVAAAE